MKKRILLITTGGTIASGVSEDGLIPALAGVQLAEYVDTEDADLEIRDLFSLDSTNIQPENWIKIGECIYRERGSYDGIVITHGTDTMAYTASALTFMLPGIELPVVLTGSQLPVTAPDSDAIVNLQTAFAMAKTGLRGIYIAFDGKVLLGCRAVKVRTKGLSAFESINHPLVGEYKDGSLHVLRDSIPELNGLSGNEKKSACALKSRLDENVCLIKLTPGIRPELIDAISGMGYRGVVIEAYGAGGVTDVNRDISASIRRMVGRGIVVVICSQCLYEETDMTIYGVGRHALQAGAVSAGDMTSEAAVTKLMWALGQENDVKSVKALFETDLHGERTR